MARIKELSGKYYGTIVEFSVGNESHQIKVWTPDHFAQPFASEREIARGWDPGEEGHDHVEDQQSYAIAQIISKALTEAGFKDPVEWTPAPFSYQERCVYEPRTPFHRKIIGLDRMDHEKYEMWLKLECGHSWKPAPGVYGPFGPKGTLHNSDDVPCGACKDGNGS